MVQSPLAKDLIGYFPLLPLEGDRGVARDVSQYGNTLRLWWANEVYRWRYCEGRVPGLLGIRSPGQYDGQASINESWDKSFTSYASVYNITQSITISLDVFFDDFQQYNAIIARWDETITRIFGLHVGGTNGVIWWDTSPTGSYVAGNRAALAIGLSKRKWYNLTVVHDYGAGKNRIYVSGRKEAEITCASNGLYTSTNAALTPHVGRSIFAASNQLLNGRIGNLAVWSRPLRDAEIAYWYSNPLSLLRKPFRFFLLPPIPASNGVQFSQSASAAGLFSKNGSSCLQFSQEASEVVFPVQTASNGVQFSQSAEGVNSNILVSASSGLQFSQSATETVPGYPVSASNGLQFGQSASGVVSNIPVSASNGLQFSQVASAVLGNILVSASSGLQFSQSSLSAGIYEVWAPDPEVDCGSRASSYLTFSQSATVIKDLARSASNTIQFSETLGREGDCVQFSQSATASVAYSKSVSSGLEFSQEATCQVDKGSATTIQFSQTATAARNILVAATSSVQFSQEAFPLVADPVTGTTWSPPSGWPALPIGI